MNLKNYLDMKYIHYSLCQRKIKIRKRKKNCALNNELEEKIFLQVTTDFDLGYIM